MIPKYLYLNHISIIVSTIKTINIFSLPQLKGQVNFSDHFLSGVYLSVRL